MDEKEDLILGFDLRVEDQIGAQKWGDQRRNEFLLRTEVIQPYSVDTIVWPSVVNSDVRPNTCIGHQDLWGDLSGLHAAVTSEGASGKFIAVGLIAEQSIVERNWWQLNAPPTKPSQPEESWQLLGYDVADRWLLSALTNCSFAHQVDRLTELKSEWKDRLNQHHLLKSLDNARAFQHFSNHRVPEHSPFFIYSIQLIQD